MEEYYLFVLQVDRKLLHRWRLLADGEPVQPPEGLCGPNVTDIDESLSLTVGHITIAGFYHGLVSSLLLYLYKYLTTPTEATILAFICPWYFKSRAELWGSTQLLSMVILCFSLHTEISAVWPPSWGNLCL